jgi:2-polyprenyl-6-methoxyphenol hydroxylase-like FAD-dependent oxidoreductase
MEDVIALIKALDEHPQSLGKALQYYEAERRPIVEKFFKASKTSAAWYRDFADHMRLSPLDFAHSYITRSGRIDDVRLREMAPRFMAQYVEGRPSLSRC